MELTSNTKLFNNKKITNFLPDPRFPQGLQLEITVSDIDLFDPSVEITVRICFYHNLPGDESADLNFLVSKKDFVNNTWRYTINTGDLIRKVYTYLEFKVPLGSNPTIKQELTETRENLPKSQISLAGLIASACFDEHLDFVTNLRALNPGDFLQLISRDLEALEAAIGVGSQQTFKKWVITDQIIRLAGRGEIPHSYVDLAVSRYADAYSKCKERLGLESIIL